MEYISIQVLKCLNNLFGTEGNTGFFGAKLFCFLGVVAILALIVFTKKAWLLYVIAAIMAFWLVVIPFMQAMVFHSEELGGIYSIIWLDREANCALTIAFWLMYLFVGVRKTGYPEADSIGLVFMVAPTIGTISCIYKYMQAGICDGYFKVMIITAGIAWIRFLFFPEKEGAK